jgi:sugar phosphate isomerase/epimerase
MNISRFKTSIVATNPFKKYDIDVFDNIMCKCIIDIKAAGYDGVELTIGNPKKINMEKLQETLSVTGLPVSAIGTGKAYGEEGISFLISDLSIRKKAVERINAHTDFSKQINKPPIIIGLLRGKISGHLEKDLAEKRLIEGLKECAGYAAESGVKIALEPINRYETDFINTIDDALELLDKIQCENVGLLLDSFHMNIEEPSIEASIRKASDKIFHFHVADSNRWTPGYGHINFKSILESLDKISYEGFISAEILPLPDEEISIRSTVKYLKAIM